MRKLFSDYGREINFTPPNMYISPSTSPSSEYYYVHEDDGDPWINFATISVIAIVLLLSLISFSFIFHFRFKSRGFYHLQSFNNLWTVRLLLVLFVSCWAINEIFPLPFFRRRQADDDLCKLHVVLSLGFLEPGFLVCLLFLINASVKQGNCPAEIRSLFSVLLMSLPTLFLQIMFVYFTPLKEKLPLVMTRTSVMTIDDLGNQSLRCTDPLMSSMIFGAFGMVYSMCLLLSCWRVVSMVINKNIKVRINTLGLMVITALLIQTVFLGAASYWTPGGMGYGGAMLGMFVGVAVCAGAGEVILVIKPILEALAAGGDYCKWSPGVPTAETDHV